VDSHRQTFLTLVGLLADFQHECIADALREDIRSGRLRAGDPLPTVVQIAAQFTVAPARLTAPRLPWPLKD
jgi:Bacterial regulatory proteins, gntR family